MVHESDRNILLAETATNVQAWFETRNLLPSEGVASVFFDQQTLASAVRLVSAAEPLIHYVAGIVQDLVPEDHADAVKPALHLELARACTSAWIGARSSLEVDLALALTAHTRDWLGEWKRIGRLKANVRIKPMELRSGAVAIPIRAEAFTYIAMASLDREIDETRNDAYLAKLQRIRSLLGIRSAELARLLRVSREAIRKWDNGEPIAAERWADIDKLNATTDALTRFIKPEHLPPVVRRTVPALDNSTPLDWLAARRYDDLVSFYERIFSYGSTA
jgi:DNA-binding transcriptional regulator YiaG